MLDVLFQDYLPAIARHLKTMPEKNSHSHRSDHVRIVPLATPEVLQKSAAPAAHLTYNNGPLITSCQVFAVFWGSSWEQPAMAGMINELNGFFDYILTSSLIDQLAEYNAPQNKNSHGKRIGTITLTSPDVSKTIDDSAIQKMIQDQISAKKFPASSPDLLLFCFSAVGSHSYARWLGFMQGVLRISRRNWKGYFLRRDAVPRLFGLLLQLF
jgi:hypothetical protein